MHDLNDLFAFAKIVQHGGFSVAARSTLPSLRSARGARLEEREGARPLGCSGLGRPQSDDCHYLEAARARIAERRKNALRTALRMT